MSNSELPESARRVQDCLDELGVECRVLIMPGSTRTAQDAADAAGCRLGQIAKALVFMGRKSQKPALVLASGKNRVDPQKLSQMTGEPMTMAKPDWVKQNIGFAIGGVPPVGHDMPLDTFIDSDLMEYERVWAAAGTPHAIFELTPQELVRISNGQVSQTK